MHVEGSPVADRSAAWRYYVCGILLLATTINYLDRQTLANTSTQICEEMNLTNEEYGRLETAFGLAFAVGAALFGVIADKVNVFWLYPLVLLLWSVMGYLTGWVETYAGLLLCRLFLGLFEAGHWPCALRTTQGILAPRERTLGNSILQSGSAIGSILTPLLVMWLVTDERGSWRGVFQIVGLTGLCWIVFWVAAVRPRDLRRNPAATPAGSQAGPNVSADTGTSFWSIVRSRRFFVLLIVVVSINTAWHINRVWLPKVLQEGWAFTKDESLIFNSVYYIVADIGCIAAGVATVWMTRAGGSVHRTRLIVYTVCALMTSAALSIFWLPNKSALMAMMLFVGAGSLGLFPCYYSFSQELSFEHQGKVTGLLGLCAWATSPLHQLLGWVIDVTKSYDFVIATAGVWPLLGAAALWFLWDSPAEKGPERSASDFPERAG
jgi:MFS transporter, ACS family, hexuronate transporter